MGNFFNMIYGVLIKFNQNLNKNQDPNGYKLLTISLLDVNKDQLLSISLLDKYLVKEILTRCDYNNVKELKNN